MGHAYTPGLKVSAAAEFVRSRSLPIPGDVLVRVGDAVGPDTVVARALLPGNPVVVNLAQKLGVPPADVAELLLVKEGAEVRQDQAVARSKGMFGLFKQEALAPASGVLESVSKVSGQAIVREAPLPVEVKAYVAGRVRAVRAGVGVEIAARGTIVQGIFGIGPETSGPIAIVGEATRPLRPEDLGAQHKGAVVVGGSLAPLAVLKRAVELGVAAVVSGGIDADELTALLGYDLGVAITGNETVGVTLVVTEGFGALPLAARTLRLLAAQQGRVASVSGATQIRAGVLRPEILVPAEVLTLEVTAVDRGALEKDSLVRIIRDPHFGGLGRVIDLPPHPALLDTESPARILTVALPDGVVVTLPRANVELVDERL